MKIKILATGGTFDKQYDEIRQVLSFRETHLSQVLRRGRCRLDVDVETVMLKDSLDMNDSDREKIAECCKRAKEDRIVITHGTDTSPETAALLAKRVHGKTIVITGALIPYTFGSSDGLFNLGCALAFVQTLPPGVYIAMNGHYFSWDNVRKDLETGFFLPKKGV